MIPTSSTVIFPVERLRIEQCDRLEDAARIAWDYEGRLDSGTTPVLLLRYILERRFSYELYAAAHLRRRISEHGSSDTSISPLAAGAESVPSNLSLSSVLSNDDLLEAARRVDSGLPPSLSVPEDDAAPIAETLLRAARPECLERAFSRLEGAGVPRDCPRVQRELALALLAQRHAEANHRFIDAQALLLKNGHGQPDHLARLRVERDLEMQAWREAIEERVGAGALTPIPGDEIRNKVQANRLLRSLDASGEGAGEPSP